MSNIIAVRLKVKQNQLVGVFSKIGVVVDALGYSGEGEHRFRREAERRSGAKANSSRSEATLAW
jgi:hypothetical protein